MEIGENYLNEIFDLNPFLAEIYSNGSPKPQTSDYGIGRKADDAKQLKSSGSLKSGHGREIMSTNPSPQLISFENSNIDMDYISTLDDQMAKDYSLTPQIISFSSSSVKDDSSKKQYREAVNVTTSHKRVCTAARTPSQAQDHLMAERKRRENLSQLFVALSKVVPGLKKLDKASLLEDAINYLKALQERVSALEKEETKTSSKDSLYADSSMNNNIIGSTRESGAAEISARIADRHVLVKFCCKKQMGLMSRIPIEMEKINLSVIDMRIMPFGGAALDVTILAQMQSAFVGTVKDIVDHLQAVFLNPTSILNSRR